MSKQTSNSDNVWWLIPEKLAGMPRPQLEDLPELKEAGIKGIVSVMDSLQELKNTKKKVFSLFGCQLQEVNLQPSNK